MTRINQDTTVPGYKSLRAIPINGIVKVQIYSGTALTTETVANKNGDWSSPIELVDGEYVIKFSGSFRPIGTNNNSRFLTPVSLVKIPLSIKTQTSTSVKGDSGPTGPKGDVGPKGDAGAKGDIGPKADTEIRIISMPDGTSFTPTPDIADINAQINTQPMGILTANAPSGSPLDGQKIIIRIKSMNVQTYAWNTGGGGYRGSTTIALPVSTSGNWQTDYIGFMYSFIDNKWDILAYSTGY